MLVPSEVTWSRSVSSSSRRRHCVFVERPTDIFLVRGLKRALRRKKKSLRDVVWP